MQFQASNFSKNRSALPYLADFEGYLAFAVLVLSMTSTEDPETFASKTFFFSTFEANKQNTQDIRAGVFD
eukprot:4826612-Amphidinium_carterae.1